MSAPAVPRMTGVRPGMLILYALVPGMLLIDMVNGVTGGATAANSALSPAEIARGGVLLACLLTLSRVRHPGLRRLQGWVLALGFLGSLGLLYAFFRGGDVHALKVNVAQLMKAIYGPILVILLVVQRRRWGLTTEELLDAVAWVAGLAGGSILLLSAAGLSNQTYLLQRVGEKGLFISQNDIGLAMGIGLAASSDLLFRTRRLRYVVLSLLGIVGMLMLGTRAAMAGAFVVPVAIVINYRVRIFGGPRRAFLGLLLVGALTLALAGAVLWEYRALRQEPFQQQKLQALADNPFVRGILVVAALDHVRQRPLVLDVIGEGSVAYGLGVSRQFGQSIEGTLAEVDWMDMYGAYGILFAVALYLFYVDSVRFAWRLPRMVGAVTARTVILALAWFLVHSAVAGHALAGTIPAGTLAPILALTWSERPILKGRRQIGE